ncbi:hypothetical protein BST61_g181 [Cercospora zeina]
MDYNDPSRRQYAQPNPYGPQQSQSSSAQPGGQYSTPGGSVERFRQSSGYLQQSPQAVLPPARASGDAQVYGFGQGSQYGAASSGAAPTMQYSTDMQGADVQRQSDNSQYPPYGSTHMYSMVQPTQQSTQSPYDPVSRYSQRPGTASETLASQIAASQTAAAQYYLAGRSLPSATVPEMAPPHLPSQYQAAAYGAAGPSSTYASAMMDPTQSGAYSYATATQYTPSSAQSVDQAFANYQNQIRTLVTNVRDGSLREVGGLLMDVSHYLLGNAEALGLTRDDDNLHDERIRLWDEFNRAWLVTLERQRELTQEYIRNQGLREPQSIMTAQILEHLSRELVRLCDSVEKHGLVDYQMGVAEEEIMDLLIECLNVLDPDNASAGAEIRRNPPGLSTASAAAGSAISQGANRGTISILLKACIYHFLLTSTIATMMSKREHDEGREKQSDATAKRGRRKRVVQQHPTTTTMTKTTAQPRSARCPPALAPCNVRLNQ